MAEKYRKGVFAIVYFIEDKKPKYLILKRKLHWTGWECPKGGIEKNESLAETIKREIIEETGLKIKQMKKFNISGKYNYNKELKDRKNFTGQTFEAVYAIEVKNQEVTLDTKEHSDFKWLDFSEALKKLTWENQKQALQKIHEDLIAKQYTGFRKKITSSGKLLLAGKTESNNEKLIKEIVKPEEIVFHTVKPGSPFVVIKNSINPTKQDIKEAAIFCAKHSHDWKDNKKDVAVHYFKGKDIYKNKSMKTGTFGVKNTKDVLVKKGWLR